MAESLIQKGKAEGWVESKAETVQLMLRKGFAIQVIAECTGLSLKEIQAIHQEIQID